MILTGYILVSILHGKVKIESEEVFPTVQECYGRTFFPSVTGEEKVDYRCFKLHNVPEAHYKIVETE